MVHSYVRKTQSLGYMKHSHSPVCYDHGNARLLTKCKVLCSFTTYEFEWFRMKSSFPGVGLGKRVGDEGSMTVFHLSGPLNACVVVD